MRLLALRKIAKRPVVKKIKNAQTVHALMTSLALAKAAKRNLNLI
jgi:hypothetical protein